MGVINLEGLVVLPLIGGLIKLALFVGVIFGWVQFWIYTRTYRRGKDIADTAQTAYEVGKFVVDKTTERLNRNKPNPQEHIPNETRRTPKTNSRGKGRKYFS